MKLNNWKIGGKAYHNFFEREGQIERDIETDIWMYRQGH